jgi:hypothetical protein
VIDAPAWRLERTWHQCVEQPLFVDGEAALHGFDFVAPAISTAVCLRGLARAVRSGQRCLVCMDTSCNIWMRQACHVGKQATIAQQPRLLLDRCNRRQGHLSSTRSAEVSLQPCTALIFPTLMFRRHGGPGGGGAAADVAQHQGAGRTGGHNAAAAHPAGACLTHSHMSFED